MARVVHRRDTPPYLLIVFVLLTLVATGLAVLFYTGREDEAKAKREANQQRTKITRERNELKNKTIPALLRLITGREGEDITPEYAREETDKVFKDVAGTAATKDLVEASQGLVRAVGNLNDRAARDVVDINKLKADLTARDKVVAGNVKTIAEMRVDHKSEVTGLYSKLRAEGTRNIADRAKLVAGHKRELQAKDGQIDRRDKKIAAQVQEVEVKNTEIQLVKVKISKLEAEIARLKGAAGDVGVVIIRKPDARIVKVLPDSNICYINLGQGDRVTPGLPFSVYSAQTGVKADEAPKAQIVVLNVNAKTSECRIVRQAAKEDPVTEGDLAANVVFDTSRTYNFVVEGEFDLYATGRLDPLGAQRVRGLIQQFGGRVSADVTIETDFVVLGEAPPVPPKPDAAAPGADASWAAYKGMLNMYNRFKAVEDSALRRRIPVLNTTRFLALTGFVPKQRLSE